MGFLIGRFDQRQRISDLCPSNSLCRMKKSLQTAINPVSTFGNVQLESVEKLLTEDANSGYQLFTKIGEKYGVVCISAAGKDNIKQKIFPLKSEKVLIIADGAAFGPQMNDIYAYDPDTEEEADQCVDEVIQIAEESGAEIQFY